MKIDAVEQLGTLALRADIDKTARNTVTLRFGNPLDRERFTAVLGMARMNGAESQAERSGLDQSPELDRSR